MEDSSAPKQWESYEQVATYLLNKFASEFGLERVVGKQSVSGASGTNWEIDAKGVKQVSEAFIDIECRRTKAGQSQAKLGSLAFVIQDTVATGGITVTPVPLQLGAQKVAAASGIVQVQLDANSTAQEFGLKFLNKLFLGVSARVSIRDEVSLTVHRVCDICKQQFSPSSTERTCPPCINT